MLLQQLGLSEPAHKQRRRRSSNVLRNGSEEPRVVTPLCTLRRALSDPKLLGTCSQRDSWLAWRMLLIAAMGEALSDDERTIFKRLTGREREPLQRVSELTFVVGRRGGKSRALAMLAVYVAALCQHQLATRRARPGADRGAEPTRRPHSPRLRRGLSSMPPRRCCARW